MEDRPPLITIEGRTHTLRRNQPIVADVSGSIWVVTRGTLDVFSTRFENGDPVGHRRHLFRLTTGRALLGYSPEPATDDYGLLAVAASQVEVVEAQVETLARSASDEAVELVAEWADQVGQYLDLGTTAGLVAGQAIPGVVELPPAEAVAGVPGVGHCFRVLEGEVSLGDLSDPFRSDHGWTLWPTQLTLRAGVDTAQIEVATLSALLSETGALKRAIEGLQGFLNRCLANQQAQEAHSELERRTKARALEREHTAAALSGLAGVLNPQEDFEVRESDLLTVVGMIGKHIGVKICPPAPSEDPERAQHTLDAIARASHLRWREITLTPNWEKRDAGPVLGFLGAEEQVPVALFAQGNSYEVVYPDGTRARLDNDIKGRLSLSAYMIYRPLPQKVRNIFGLMFFTARGQLRDAALIILAGTAATLLGMLVPWTIGVLFDTAIPEADRRMLYEIALLLLVAAVAGTVFTLVQALASIRLGIRRDIVCQAATWDRVLQLRPAFFRSFSSGDLQTRVDAVSDINRQLGAATLRPLVSGLLALLNFGLLWHYSPELAMIAFWIGVLVMAVTIGSSYVIQRLSYRLMEMAGAFHGMVIELIGSVSKLRLTGSEYRVFCYWASRYTPQLKLELTIDRLSDAVALFHLALLPIATGLLFWKATNLLIGSTTSAGGTITMGTFIAFSAAFGLYLSGWSAISSTIVSIIDTLVQAKRVKPILEGELEVGQDAVDPGRLSGRIALDGVTFRYHEDGQAILDDINLEIEPGELVAIVGPSGSGKSTLLRLLLGFEHAESGRVLYDGKDLVGLDVNAVRRQIGTVLQNGRLTSGSVFENIANHRQVSHAEAWEAAADAGLAEDLEALPMGIHTVVAEGGTNLSGGQRQRLLIARALVGRPKMVFFDEATSALDNRTQAVVTKALDRRRVARLVIAHRLSTIRNADRLYVLDGGRIVQQGSFEKLSTEVGIFRDIISRQLT
mgnify:FL=1